MPLTKPKPVVCKSRKQGRGTNKTKANLAETQGGYYEEERSMGNGRSINKGENTFESRAQRSKQNSPKYTRIDQWVYNGVGPKGASTG